MSGYRKNLGLQNGLLENSDLDSAIEDLQILLEWLVPGRGYQVRVRENDTITKIHLSAFIM